MEQGCSWYAMLVRYWYNRIHISTAQVSRQINALEKRLNIKLFYRTTRNVAVTQEGQLFYQHCRNVVDGLEAAEQAILARVPRGTEELNRRAYHLGLEVAEEAGVTA